MKTLERATACQGDFKCLNGGKSNVCPVDSKLTENALSIKSEHTFSCQYFLYYGNKLICRCPVHVELYDKYHF